MNYDAYIFDQDGTIYLGDQPLPGASETIAALRAAGKRTIFLSNNPTKTREQYALKLGHMGIVTPLEDIVNSSFVLVQWLLSAAADATLFVVGEEPLKSDLRAAGFRSILSLHHLIAHLRTISFRWPSTRFGPARDW
jgi:arabinose operon protein AraL